MQQFVVHVDVELCVFTCVGYCGCPISSKVILRMVPIFLFSYRTPVSASAAEDMKFSIMIKEANTDPLSVVSSYVAPMYK